MRVLLILLGAVHLLFGLAAIYDPVQFFESIPGLKMMGGYNVHLVRDVGLALSVSGAAIVYGAMHWNQTAAVVGAGWPLMHALFHLQIQIGRGLPMDNILLFDVFIVILPALIAMALALKLQDAA